jgi:hypothetical protein
VGAASPVARCTVVGSTIAGSVPVRSVTQCPLERTDTLRQLLISRGASATADVDALLETARASEHKLAVTLLSAHEAAGQELRPDQQAELAINRHRIERYRKVWSVVSGAAPDAFVVKGSSIASRYPQGLLRAAGDMDVICPAAQLWLAAQALIEDGWEVGAFTIFPGRGGAAGTGTGRDADGLTAGAGAGPGRDAGGLEIVIELNQPSDTDIEEPYGVELRTIDVGTSVLRPACRLAVPLSPVAANVLALVAERWERPFRSRDVYDLAVLHDHLDRAELASLGAGLTATGMWREMRELSRLLRRSGLRPAPDLPQRRRSTMRAGTARLVQSAIRWSHPVRVLGYASMSTVDSDRGARADRLAQVVQERIGPSRLLRLGLPLFAVPLPVVPQSDVPLPVVSQSDVPAGPGSAAMRPSGPMRLVRVGPHLVAVTPIGAFLMVAGSCPQSWVTQATSGLSAAP